MKEEPDDLDLLRAEIDQIDGELISLLSRRAEVARRIGKVKADHGLEVWDVKRVAEMMDVRRSMARNVGLDEDFVFDLFERIIKFCVRLQETQPKDAPK